MDSPVLQQQNEFLSANTSTQAAGTPKSNWQIPQYVLDDLCSRFIINIPEEEREDLIRIFFQIELAHWFYLDFYCTENPDLRSCGIKDFSSQIFNHCPFLTKHANSHDQILVDWKSYKLAVPTYGAILLDPCLQYVLLVQGFWAKSSWGFPKGKVNEEELPAACAIREVLEETGFDISDLIDETNYIEHKVSDQTAGLFVIPGVSMTTKFQPRTRGEIKQLRWFDISHLPMHKKDMAPKINLGMNQNSFFMITPFVKPLRKWIQRKLGKTPDQTDQGDSGQQTQGKPRQKRDSGSEVKQLTEKQKLRQQQYFAQQNLSEFQDYLGLKSNKDGKIKGLGKDTKQRSLSPKSNKKTRQQSESPQKVTQMQILNRDGSVSGGTPGHPRRSLATQFDNTQQFHQSSKVGQQQKGQKRQFRKEEFNSKTWTNFKFDTDTILRAMLME